jgi:hypothetical protein
MNVGKMEHFHNSPRVTGEYAFAALQWLACIAHQSSEICERRLEFGHLFMASSFGIQRRRRDRSTTGLQKSRNPWLAKVSARPTIGACKADHIFHVKPWISELLLTNYPSVALSALAFLFAFT